MSKREVYRAGQYFPAPVPANTLAGVPLRLGSLNCVTVTKEGVEGGNYPGQTSVDTGGAHTVDVVITTNPLAFGDKVYIKADGSLSNVATSATWFGIYIEPMSTPVGTAPCVVKVLAATV